MSDSLANKKQIWDLLREGMMRSKILFEEQAPNAPAIVSDPKAAAKFEQKVNDLLKFMPKFVPNESWGNPNSVDRKAVDDLFYWVRKDAAQGATGPERVAIAFKKIICNFSMLDIQINNLQFSSFTIYQNIKQYIIYSIHN